MELSLTTPYRHHLHPITTLNHHRRRPNSITFPKSSLNPNFQNPNPNIPKKSTNPLKTTFITGVTVAAVLLSRFTPKPAVAAPLPPAAAVQQQTQDQDQAKDREEEVTLEQYLCSNPDDVNTLKALMEIKIKNGKVHEAVGILNQLINLDPDDGEWELLKHHLHAYAGDHKLAKLGFEDVIAKDPLRVEAYHGLVMAAASNKESDNSLTELTELNSVRERILDAVEICKKGRKKDEIRDFKLLLAQIHVIRGEYSDAIGIYEELVKEEPRDFRPYLCQGIIYTLLGKNEEAERNFEKYRRLVPKGHPYTRYFDDNMVATKVFAQKVEQERAYSKS